MSGAYNVRSSDLLGRVLLKIKEVCMDSRCSRCYGMLDTGGICACCGHREEARMITTSDQSTPVDYCTMERGWCSLHGNDCYKWHQTL